MKIILVACLVGAVYAAPQFPAAFNPYYNNNPAYYNPNQYNPYNQYYRNPGPFVPILSQTNDINPDGSYQYSYTTGDGQQAAAQGYLRNLGGSEGPAEVAQGSYSYTSPEGTPIQVNWVADEFGFRVQGPHIPASIQTIADYNIGLATGQASVAPFIPQYSGRYYRQNEPQSAPTLPTKTSSTQQ